ncbi:MAG: MBL fold metallo-hydrolase [Gammaproteobacteria bacterium]|nr:MBL fold metallo-hydrolase [Gammaproteobacteria bacterium]
MKTLISVLLIISYSYAQATEIPDYPADKISANTYVIHGPLEFPNEKNQGFMNNPGFVITNDGVVVIDPGSSRYSGDMVLRQIRKLTSKPVTHVINTHIHGDHWLGNQAFSEAFPAAKLMAHPDMIALAKKSEAVKWINLMQQMTNGATKGTKAVIPETAVEDSFVLKTGGFTFKVYAPAKAHSKTDVMVHVLEESVVFLGDNVLSGRLPSMGDATFRGNAKACEIASNINAKHFVPGHGQTSDVSIVKQFQNYVSTVYQQAARYYDEGLSDFEMKPQVVKQLTAFHQWVNFDDEIGRHISLAVLEAERAAFE